jgi:hypothetical protein
MQKGIVEDFFFSENIMENVSMEKANKATINFLQTKILFVFPFKKRYRGERRDMYAHRNVKQSQN